MEVRRTSEALQHHRITGSHAPRDSYVIRAVFNSTDFRQKKDKPQEGNFNALFADLAWSTLDYEFAASYSADRNFFILYRYGWFASNT